MIQCNIANIHLLCISMGEHAMLDMVYRDVLVLLKVVMFTV